MLLLLQNVSQQQELQKLHDVTQRNSVMENSLIDIAQLVEDEDEVDLSIHTPTKVTFAE